MTEFCKKINRPYYKSNYPKTCQVCQKTYHDREIYLEQTRPLRPNSLVGRKNMVLELRNCVCGNTLSIKLKDLRDYSAEGNHKRQKFKMSAKNSQ